MYKEGTKLLILSTKEVVVVLADRGEGLIEVLLPGKYGFSRKVYWDNVRDLSPLEKVL